MLVSEESRLTGELNKNFLINGIEKRVQPEAVLTDKGRVGRQTLTLFVSVVWLLYGPFGVIVDKDLVKLLIYSFTCFPQVVPRTEPIGSDSSIVILLKLYTILYLYH